MGSPRDRVGLRLQPLLRAPGRGESVHRSRHRTRTGRPVDRPGSSRVLRRGRRSPGHDRSVRMGRRHDEDDVRREFQRRLRHPAECGGNRACRRTGPGRGRTLRGTTRRTSRRLLLPVPLLRPLLQRRRHRLPGPRRPVRVVDRPVRRPQGRRSRRRWRRAHPGRQRPVGRARAQHGGDRRRRRRLDRLPRDSPRRSPICPAARSDGRA